VLPNDSVMTNVSVLPNLRLVSYISVKQTLWNCKH
jgi:hypothetical protein